MNGKRRFGKRLISMALAVVLTLSCVPVDTYATEVVETEPVIENVAVEPVEEIQEESVDMVETVQTEMLRKTYIPDVDLPSNEELFATYVEQELYGYEFSFWGVAAGERLSGPNKQLYEALKAEISKIASGNLESALISVDAEILKKWNVETSFSALDSTSAMNSFEAQFDIASVFYALLSDCPYDLYWFDKTTGLSCGPAMNIWSTGVEGELKTYEVTKFIFYFSVITEYQATDYTSQNLLINTDKTGATSEAVENAKEVVETNKNKSDYEKLLAYKNYICDETDYNYEVVKVDYAGGYGDPWQLIYVFDEDDSTKVVCEGYSKAFQYLCDLTTFSSEKICCYSVSGDTGGAHMWNIVTMEDGNNYLVDVTNSDTGTVGHGGQLFLVGATASADGRYTFTTTTPNITYTYDSETKAIWGTDTNSILNLASTNYTVKTDISNATVAIIIADIWTYTGKEIIPEITVTLNETELVGGKHYEATYSNNINAGTANIEIKGIGEYSGTVNKTFTINPHSVDAENLTLEIEDADNIVYTGVAHCPKVNVTYGGYNVVEDTDYTVSYTNNTNVGIATVAVTFINNFSGTGTITFEILAGEITEPQITLSETSFVYDGFPKEPTVESVKNGDVEISADEYSVEYSNNTNAGTGTVTIVDKEGGNYTVSGSTTFTIEKAELDELKIVNYKDSVIYGDAFTIDVTGNSGDGEISWNATGAVSVEQNSGNSANVRTKGIGDAEITVTVAESTNYKAGTASWKFTVHPIELTVSSVSVEDKIYDGNATVKITNVSLNTIEGGEEVSVDLDKLTGTVASADAGTYNAVTVSGTWELVGDSAEYYTLKQPDETIGTNVTIRKATAQSLEDITASVIFNSEKLTVENLAKGMPEDAGILGYTVGEVTGSGLNDIAIEGNTLTANIADVTVGSTVKIPVTISSTNYEDSIVIINVSFASEILTEEDVIITVNDATYDGSEQKQTVAIQLMDTNINLTQGTDFEVEYPTDCKNVGTKNITIKFKGSYGGEINTSYEIMPCSVAGATVNVSTSESLVYTGEVITPSFEVKIGNVSLVKDTDYTVTYLGTDESHINVGTVNVEITGINNYKDTVNASYKIEQASLADANVTVNGTFQYSGSEIQPETLTVMWNNRALTAGTDYKITDYADNTNAGEATVTVTGKGNFKDTAKGKFTINKAPVDISGTDAQITFGTDSYDVSSMFRIDSNAGTASYAIAGSSAVGTLSDKTLTITNAGTIVIKVTTEETGNYLAGEATATLTVQKASLANAEISLSENSFVYDGTVKEPSVTVSLNKKELIAATDYSIVYNNNTDAGEATVTVTALDNSNYTDAKVVTFTISQATGTVDLVQTYAKEYTFTDSAITEPTEKDVTTNIYNPSITFTWYEGSTVDESKKLTGAPSAIGTYTLKVDVAETNNYTAATLTIGVAINAFVAGVTATLADTNEGSDNWYRGDITVQAPNGFTISETIGGTYASSFIVTDDSDYDGTDVTYFLKQDDTGYITEAQTINVKRDTVAPSGEITIATNHFKEFMNDVTFGLFFKKTVDVTIEGTDALSGVDKVYYQKVVSDTNYSQNGTWTEGETLSVAPNEKFIVYAKICDKAGNTTIVNSNGVVVYTDATQDTAEIVYTKLSGTDLQAGVNLNGNTIHTVSIGSDVLTKDTDYTVNNNVITFKSTCFDALNAGSHEIKISYNPFGETYVSADGNEAPAVTTISLTINRAKGEITEVADLSKTYDGQAVKAPAVTTAGKGAVKAEYKLKDALDSTYTTTAPKNAGEYTVRVTVAADANYTEATAEKNFTISKVVATSEIDTSVTSQSVGKSVVITVKTFNNDNISATPVSIRVQINVGNETITQTLAQKSAGVYTGTYTIPADIEAGTSIVFSVDGASDANFAIASDEATITISEKEKTPLQAPESENGKDYKVEKEDGISEVPEELEKRDDLNTPEKIENKVKSSIKEKYKNVPSENVEVYDVVLMYSDDGGKNWKKADENNFPNSGKLTVVLPYPAGTGKNTHTFVVTHMFTTNAFGKTPGDVEYPTVRKTDAGIEFEVTGLSPIAVGWTEVASSGGSSSSNNSSIAMFTDTGKYIPVDTSIDNDLIEEAKDELRALIGDSYGLYRVALAADLKAELSERTKIKILIDGLTKADATIILHKGPDGWEVVSTEEGEGYVIGTFTNLSPVVVFVDEDGAVEYAKLTQTAKNTQKTNSGGALAATGDAAQPMWYILLAVVAIVAVGGLHFYNKKKRSKKE